MSIFGAPHARATKVAGGHPSNPAWWVKKLFGGGTETITGIEVDEDSALHHSPVWSAVNLIAGAIGFLPLKLFERLDGDAREAVPGHPVYRLLHDRPNKYMDALAFRETLQAHALTWGNGYAEIERNGAGRPINLWPLRPDRTTPKVLSDGTIVYEVRFDGEPNKYIPYEDMLHIKGLGFDGLRGYSVISYAANSLSVGMAAEKFAGRFFANGASPTGALQHPETLSDTAEKHLRESMEAGHTGLDNAHRMMIFEEGMEWQQIGISPEDSQLLESRRFGIGEVSRWFNIPPHMLHDTERATFNNIEHLGMNFVRWTLGTWMRRWELETAYKLLTEAERARYYAEFIPDALLRGDTKTRYEAYRIAVGGPWMAGNEVRAKENMGPREGLDEVNAPPNEAGGAGGGTDGSDTEAGSEEAAPRTYEPLLADTWKRVVTREVRALRKALKKPDAFAAYLEDFYEKHRQHTATVFSPVLCAIAGRGGTEDTVADSYVERRVLALRDALRDLSGATVPERVEPLLQEWESAPFTGAGHGN